MTTPISSSIAGAPTQSLNLAGGLENLRIKADKDPKSAVREAAKQFEQMFTQQLLKQMRDSSMNSDMMENEGTKMGTEMLDSQWASKMSGMPGGLSDVIARQLERQMGIAQGVTAKPATANPMPVDPLHADAPVALPQKAAASLHPGAHRRRGRRREDHRHPRQVHDRAGRARDGLGPQGDQERRRLQLVQPVRHEGRPELEGRDHRHHDHRVHRRPRRARSRRPSAPTRASPTRSPTTPAR